MARCTIDGRPVLDGSVEWIAQAGTKPTASDFEMTPDDAQALVQGGLAPVTLEIDDRRFHDLYVIEDRPAETRETTMVRLVDRRWFWPRKHVDVSFNVRRHVGVKRVKAGANRPELDPLQPEVAYAPWSLRAGYPWTAEQALKRVWQDVRKVEQETTGNAPELLISDDITRLTVTSLPLEDIMLHDPGDVALARLLAFIPGARITVDADGGVRVYSVGAGTDGQILEDMGPEQDGGGHIEFVTNDRIRPREVRVFFAPEVELRIDYQSPEGGDTGGGTVAVLDEDTAQGAVAENVLPIPDYSLTIDVRGISLDVAQGTYVDFETALEAWGEIPNWGSLTIRALRKALVPYMDLWTGPRIAGLGDNKADWGSRISAAQTHFRRTFRLDRKVVDRIQAVRAYRVGTIDPETGTRAPAVVYQDWAVLATQRFLSAQLANGEDSFKYATNFNGKLEGPIDSTSRAAPANVTVVDSDQGILRIEFLVDPYRLHEQILPSRVVNVPSGDINAGLLAWNAVSDARPDVPELRAEHRVTMLVTVVPAAPNGIGRLFRVTKKPGDIADILPPTLSAGLSNANGPPLDVFVGPGWETARIPWVDAEANKIKRALGIAEEPQKEGEEDKLYIQDLADLVMNLADQKELGIAGASLDAIANAVAASVYAGFANRPEGQKTTPASFGRDVDGFIEQMVYRVLPDGESTVQARIGERQDPFDIMGFMPHSVRKLILRLADVGKGAAA